jgi:hypothetical protein
MKKRISYVSPLQAGIVLALLYALISLVLVPFLILGALFSHGGFGIVFIIFLPIIYGIAGFIGGIIGALVYNLVAKWTGGIEMVLTDVP